jgi:hypothetical protein
MRKLLHQRRIRFNLTRSRSLAAKVPPVTRAVAGVHDAALWLRDSGPIADRDRQIGWGSSTSPPRAPLSTAETASLTRGARSSETTGFPFGRKHWCRCQTSRGERVTQPPHRPWPTRGSLGVQRWADGARAGRRIRTPSKWVGPGSGPHRSSEEAERRFYWHLRRRTAGTGEACLNTLFRLLNFAR